MKKIPIQLVVFVCGMLFFAGALVYAQKKTEETAAPNTQTEITQGQFLDQLRQSVPGSSVQDTTFPPEIQEKIQEALRRAQEQSQ